METISRSAARGKPPRRRSLKRKWTGLICAAVFVSLFGATALVFATVKASLEDTFARANAVQVESATREMRMMIEQHEHTIEQLAKSIETAGTFTGDAGQAVNRLLADALAEDSSLQGAYFISASNGEMTKVPEAAGASGDARDTPIYRLAERNGETSWTDVRLDAFTQTMTVSVVTPVLTDGQMSGAVGLDVDLNGIGELRRSTERFGKNKIIIYDNQGLIVSSFMEGMDGRNIDPSAADSAGAPNVIEDPGEMKRKFGWVENVDAGQRSGIEFEWDGVSYAGDVSFVYSMNWTVVSFVDKSALTGSLLEFVGMSAVAMVLGLVLGAAAAYYIAARLLAVIRSLRETIARTAEGDLVAEFAYGRDDELGDLAKSYNTMLASVRGLIRKVDDSVAAVETTAEDVRQIANDNVVSGMEVARATEEIALGASNTSAEVEKSSQAVHRLSDQIGTLIAQSGEIERALAESGRHVRQGNNDASDLARSYGRLELALNEVTVTALELDRRSQSIFSVMKAIADITEQTNLLSINASIEAARAGEHGRGFAVVANEVRSLADQARRSANLIQDTIEVVLAHTRSLVEVVAETNAVNESQKSAVSRVGETMKNMNVALGRIQLCVEEELRTITDIEALKETVVASIETISSVSEQTTASTEQIASSVQLQADSLQAVSGHANRLVGLVEELKHSVRRFKSEEA